MMYVYYLLFVVGLVYYALALLNHAEPAHMCYTNTGNGLLLITAVLLLIRIAYRVQRIANPPK